MVLRGEGAGEAITARPPFRLRRTLREAKIPQSLTCETYRIEDCLQGLSVTQSQGFEQKTIVAPDAAEPHFQLQVAILKAVKRTFESSLFDIRHMVQADLFDSDLDAAGQLAKNKFTRPTGVLAGVVLERHLAHVCENHAIKMAKKSPVIADLNNALKEANIIDVPQWRFVQHLADLRNLCSPSKAKEPTVQEVDDLLAGVRKTTKTLF